MTKERNTSSRRTFLARLGIATAATATGSSVALAAGQTENPEALALWREFVTYGAKVIEVEKERERRYVAASVPAPADLDWSQNSPAPTAPNELWAFLVPHVGRGLRPGPNAPDDIHRLYRVYIAWCNAQAVASEAHDTMEGTRAAIEAETALDAIAGRIANTRTTTATGLAIKATAAAWVLGHVAKSSISGERMQGALSAAKATAQALAAHLPKTA